MLGHQKEKLEGCIDDERQFKTAKSLVTPQFWNGFSAITSLFFVVDRKESHFFFGIGEFFYVCVYMQIIFNFRDKVHSTAYPISAEETLDAFRTRIHGIPRELGKRAIVRLA